MLYISQTIFSQDSQGRLQNSLQACVASVCNLSLEEVPHFIEKFVDWESKLKLFLKDNNFRASRTLARPPLGIAIGDSQLTRNHAIVVSEMLDWDPSFSQDCSKSDCFVTKYYWSLYDETLN